MTYDLELKLPIFEISDSRKEFGAWHSTPRILRLSRHLIYNYSWSVTLQVLKHEMAHQLCTEILATVGHTAWGRFSTGL